MDRFHERDVLPKFTQEERNKLTPLCYLSEVQVHQTEEELSINIQGMVLYMINWIYW